MMFDDLGGNFGWWRTPPALRRQDFSDEVLLFLSGEMAAVSSGVPYAGALVVTDDPALMDRTVTLGAVDPTLTIDWVRDASPDRPIFWISEAVAERLLAGAGLTLEEARAMQAGLEVDQVETIPLDTSVSMQLEGTVEEQLPVAHVIGHLPGDSHEYDENMIVVMAQYDSPPINPAVEFPNANDNASGVAVMLEIIEAMRESDYQPYKTFLFIAYSNEGQEGGELLGVPDIDDFLAAKQGFQGNFEIEAVIHLRGVGAGTGTHPIFESGGSLRLAELFGIASRRMDTGAERVIEEVDIGVVAAEGSGIVRSQQESAVSVHWAGWEETSRTAEDTSDEIEADRLERVGEWVAHALMMMGRDTTR